jgi:hypothetical protein
VSRSKSSSTYPPVMSSPSVIACSITLYRK